ncbi:hypothetical protein [Nocardioides deserti]|uniref:Uncharacterized protein n=1 Tax=Nocardioides deserti TaxID=1588644 RepID=A0ABR6U5S4_9ACTN|nr:hypothetical protein [Nocardioides deserti]MBC2959665.1 hypothetical protein [Nocardioides deserti]GGO74207.1 hypothetical protein GCM10012276_21690 [Nocardioides deserti]
MVTTTARAGAEHPSGRRIDPPAVQAHGWGAAHMSSSWRAFLAFSAFLVLAVTVTVVSFLVPALAGAAGSTAATCSAGVTCSTE